MNWHLVSDWTLELHSGDEPDEIHEDCAILGKFMPEECGRLEGVMDAHNKGIATKDAEIERLNGTLKINLKAAGKALSSAGKQITELKGDNAALRSRIEELEQANSTRPDYDLRCEQCGRAHILDTSISSDIW